MATRTKDIEQALLQVRRRKNALLAEQAPPEERGFFRRAVDFFTGETPAEEDLPALGSIREGLTTPQKMKIAAGMLATPNEGKVAQIVQSVVPGAKIEQDKFGNFVVEFGEDTPELQGQRFAVNPAGADLQDLFTVLAEVTKFLPAAKFTAAGTTAGRQVGRAMLAEGLTEAASQAASGALGADVDLSDAAISTALTAAGGGAGQAFSSLAIPFIRQVVRTRKFVQGGKLTTAGEQAAREAGIDPEIVDSTLANLIGTQLARRTPVGGAPPSQIAGTTALAQRFNVPVTRGQRTQDISLLSNEEVLRNTEPTRSTIRAFDEAQRERMRAAQENIQAGLGGPGVRTPAEGGGVAGERLKALKTDLEGRIDNAFTEARSQGADFTGKSMRQLGKIAGEIARDFPSDSKLTPGARSVLTDINKLSKRVARVERSSKLKPVDLVQFDVTRRRINTTINSIKNPADKNLAVKLKSAFDDYVDDAFRNQLFVGDLNALEKLKQARGLRTQLRTQFGKRNANDEAGKIVQKIIDIDATPEQTANAILGAGMLGRRDVSSKVVNRVAETLGRDSPEFGAIKEAAFLRLTQDRSPRQMATQVRNFLRDSPSLAEALFTEQERTLLGQYATLMEKIAPAPGQLNPSRTGFTMDLLTQGTASTLRVAQQKMVFGGNALLGNALGIIRGLLTTRGGEQGARLRAARAAMRDVLSQTSRIPTAAGAGLGEAFAGEVE